MATILLLVLALGAAYTFLERRTWAQAQEAPRFEVDPFWPKALPNHWVLGQAIGVWVDEQDVVWIVHRGSATLADNEKGLELKNAECCAAAPPILAFDASGNLVRSWGGPGAGYDWPTSEHGIFVDVDGNVWLAGNSNTDHQILKFTPDGRFLQQIGKRGSTGGSSSTSQLGRPAHMVIDAATGEMYVADGYGNRRVLVLDSKSGAYKRHWGAYGNVPNDDKQPAYDPAKPLLQQFGNPVHCVRLSRDGFVYVCDRANDRIQVFEKSGKFVKEFRVEPATLQNGSVWDLVLSEDVTERYIFVADGANNQILVLDRQTGVTLSTFSRAGRMAGELKWVHNMAIDSKGNLYTAEVGTGRRAQKFKRVE